MVPEVVLLIAYNKLKIMSGCSIGCFQ